MEIVIVLAVFLAIQAYQQRGALKGQAPALQAFGVLEGRMLDLSEYRGKPVMLHFWASWCGVCKACQHNIRAVAADYAVVTVASQSGPVQAVRDYLAEHPMNAAVLLDEHGLFAQRFGVRAFPTTFILDAEGNIRDVEVGYSSELGLRLRMWRAGL